MEEKNEPFKVTLKLSSDMVEKPQKQEEIHHVKRKKFLIGSKGGHTLKELLSTAPNPEEAIKNFQNTYGLQLGRTSSSTSKKNTTKSTYDPTPAFQLLDLFHYKRSSIYQDLLEVLLKEMKLRIEELSQQELQKLLECTFPYIEFRELRPIPIAILSRQENTPEIYLRELTENRRILNELPVHVRRKILHVEPQELRIFVEECTKAYVEEQMEWYTRHYEGYPTRHGGASSSSSGGLTATTPKEQVIAESWNHHTSGENVGGIARKTSVAEERRKQSPALNRLSEMIGDSEELYLSTLEILKEYVVAASIPGSTNINPKEYVDYVPFLGALRADLANLQRDRTTHLLRTDPMHKFIWFLDRAIKNSTIETIQMHELLAFIKRLREGELPIDKKFKKRKSGALGVGGAENEEEEVMELVLGPPPIEELCTLLDKIGKVDNRMIFSEPVPENIPGYRDVTKQPMDLSTMRKKAKRGKYKSLNQFKEDFDLMINNCLTFNPDTTIFYKEAKRVSKKGHELIDKNATTLRGSPQRLRAKKRRKGSSGEAICMLSSTGASTMKDMGDFEQTGMIAEGVCSEMLADVALILCDPLVKKMLCDTLLKTLHHCAQAMELPTDSHMCRGIVQLLQIGNPSSVRRMLRKKDYVLRSPQVIIMRMVLPLLSRTMLTQSAGLKNSSLNSNSGSNHNLSKLIDESVWEGVLGASSTIRMIMRTYLTHCIHDGFVNLGSQVLQLLIEAEGDSLLRDRVFLHELADVVLSNLKKISHGNPTTPSASASSSSVSSEHMRNSSIWKLFVEGFFVSLVETQTREAIKIEQVLFIDTDAPDGEEEVQSVKNYEVKYFPVSILHEKLLMMLSQILSFTDLPSALVSNYVKKCLFLLRSGCTLDEFKLLWESPFFKVCREFYEPLIEKHAPELKDQLFIEEGTLKRKEELKQELKQEVVPENVSPKEEKDAQEAEVDESAETNVSVKVEEEEEEEQEQEQVTKEESEPEKVAKSESPIERNDENGSDTKEEVENE